MAQFLELTKPHDGVAVRILDVGGTIQFWENCWPVDAWGEISVTLLNLSNQQVVSELPVNWAEGDARNLCQFGNGQFDWCFSNSVIEHVGTLADQLRMASEVRRVARGYFVQTPYRYFPIEPHHHFPGWAQLPIWLRTALHQRMDLGWIKAEPNYLSARIDVEGIRLLSLREFRLLFPDAEIRYERIGPFLKSITAVRKV